MKMMTLEEWRLKKENDKKVKESIERSRQIEFAMEQSKESRMTREFNSIVDIDN